MGQRILIRSGKAPQTPVSAEESLSRDVLARNAGNLLFGESVHRNLAVPGVEIDSDGYALERGPVSRSELARINEEYDALVLPLANAFRVEFADRLHLLTEHIEQLDIPVVVVGVGAQLDVEGRERPDVEGPVRRFLRAVLDRSATVGVRGEITAGYLRSLGFSDADVSVIGCPSLFRHGGQLEVRRTPPLTAESRISLNFNPQMGRMGALIEAARVRYPKLEVVGQTAVDLHLLLHGEGHNFTADASIPCHPAHPLFLEDRIRFFVDPTPWLEHLADVDFSVGTRIHGNVAALLAGTPAYVLPIDSRTRELAEYHEIPHRLLGDLDEDTDLAELHGSADYGALVTGHGERYARFAAFLEDNGLAHVGQPGNANEHYEQELASVDFPLVRSLVSDDTEAHLRRRIAGLEQTLLRQRGKLVEQRRTIADLRRRTRKERRRAQSLRDQLAEREDEVGTVPAPTVSA